MLYIPKFNDYLKILTDEEVRDFVALNFREYFKSTREKLHAKLREQPNFKKVAKSLYIFLPGEVEKYVQSYSSGNCIRCSNVEILNLFDPELQLIHTKPMNKNQLK